MALFWTVHEIDGVLRVLIQEADALIYARLKASFDGVQGRLIEGHALDAKMARKVPKKMVGRLLSAKEAQSLLRRLEG